MARAAELGASAAWSARIAIVDPGHVRLLVRYDGARPTLAEWRARYPDALAVINGSFYSEDGPRGKEVRPTCDLVSDGRPLRGAGCHVREALFFGAERHGEPLQASLPTRPGPAMLAAADFRPEQWNEALKSFPALVRGGVARCAASRYCTESSRTAAVALMKDGRVLFFASQWPAIRRDVAKWLAEQVGAADALNLDGGPEATLALKDEPLEETISTPGIGLPLVILVVAR